MARELTGIARLKGRASFLAACAIGALLVGCNLMPSKPEAVFVLYRDRMKAENLDQARELLSGESRELALQLISLFKLKQPPEDLALLNVLDPVSAPVVVKVDDTSALLQARTLKGGLRLVRLTRKDPNSHWKLDIADDLRSLRTFLEAKAALDVMREQAGEYAASWKAFNNQIGRMNVTEPPPREPPAPRPPQHKPPVKKKPKPAAKPRHD